MLETEPIDGPERLAALEPEWSRLWDRAPGATPFQSPWWLLPWWRHLFRGGQMRALALRAGGRLAGLAPLFAFGGTGSPRRLAWIGSGISDYLDVLLEPESAAAGAAALLAHLAGTGSEWDACDLQELREDSPLLGAQVPAPLRAARRPCSICPVVALPAAMEELEARLPSTLRRNYRHARRKLEGLGANFEIAGADTLEEFLAALYELHQSRWRERNDSGVLRTPALRAFYSEAAGALLDRGLLRLYGLRLDRRLIAVIYGIAAHGRFYAYISGFDTAEAKLSPGTVLVGMALERSIAEGLREFDFLRKTESYKREWGAADRQNWQLLLEHD